MIKVRHNGLLWKAQTQEIFIHDTPWESLARKVFPEQNSISWLGVTIEEVREVKDTDMVSLDEPGSYCTLSCKPPSGFINSKMKAAIKKLGSCTPPLLGQSYS